MRKQLAELGQEPPPMSECPADIRDFPPIVLTAFDIFDQLPDNYIPRMDAPPIYAGKNILALPILFEMFHIDDANTKTLILELLNLLDSFAKKELNRKK